MKTPDQIAEAIFDCFQGIAPDLLEAIGDNFVDRESAISATLDGALPVIHGKITQEEYNYFIRLPADEKITALHKYFCYTEYCL